MVPTVSARSVATWMSVASTKSRVRMRSGGENLCQYIWTFRDLSLTLQRIRLDRYSDRKMVTEREQREKNSMRRDKISGYFLDMSKLTFGTLVLGDIFPMLNEVKFEGNALPLLLGVFMTIIYAIIGYRILK